MTWYKLHKISQNTQTPQQLQQWLLNLQQVNNNFNNINQQLNQLLTNFPQVQTYIKNLEDQISAADQELNGEPQTPGPPTTT